ncbi:MAG: HD domain-containing protein [Pseudomonadota bacterium]
MERYKMLDNIRAHSIIVEKVARTIADGLMGTGTSISLKKVTAGALMHDIGKTLCLNSNEDHAAKGREICIENHLGEIAEIVGQHIRLKDNTITDDGIDEREIVYYADKRVNHDRVVSLEERVEYLINRYGRKKEQFCQLIRENFVIYKRVEGKIFAHLNFRPEDLEEMIG